MIHAQRRIWTLKVACRARALKLAATSDMEVVIIRPPLVYGPGVRVAFRASECSSKIVPLPFGRVQNLRSFISLENLVSVIIASMDCKRTPQAKNQVLLVSDGEDVSLTELLEKLHLHGVQARLLPAPVWLMTLVMRLTGRSGMAQRLFGNLRVDGTSAQNLLGWEPSQAWMMSFFEWRSMIGRQSSYDSSGRYRFRLTGLFVLSPVMFVLFAIGILDTGSPIFRRACQSRNDILFGQVSFHASAQVCSSHLVVRLQLLNSVPF